MLWGPPPPPQRKQVLYLTAELMRLKHCPGEPLRLDAAFYPEDGCMIGKVPLPMVVAIEYENDIKTFQEELLKLALVRCPLKVGITYTAMDKTDAKNLKRGQDRSDIGDQQRQIAQDEAEQSVEQDLFDFRDLAL